MSEFTYTGFMHRAMDIYAQHGSAAAHHFVCEHVEDGQANPAQLYNLQYSLRAACGRKEEALALLKEAVLEKGYWYSPDYLLDDEDLSELRDEPGFEQVVAVCRDREAQAIAQSTAALQIVLPDDEQSPSSLRTLFVLHGELENNEAVEPVWKPALDRGYKLALLQSSQVQFSDAYDWNDMEQASGELEHAMMELARIDSGLPVAGEPESATERAQEHMQDGERTTAPFTAHKPVLAGFSAGARVALYTAGLYPAAAAGLILVAPWLPHPEEWQEALNDWKEHGMKLYMICGEHDEDCRPGVEELAAELKARDIPHVLHMLPGLEHNYPVHFTDLLQQAVDWMQA
ncbi:alpha/beta hydrolase [Paenibacillus kandeliae]|uniref:alpha/beta hydrolase n=1 Tax=Paenibacillus kandeliae TaxID=3231269 RepID=UPI003457DAD4